MAGRKVKQTVDYFPHFCSHKRTMYIIERQFGNDGYALWFKTLELLGKTEGHLYDCNEVDNWEFYLSYCRINSISATEILNKLSELGAIDPELWQKKLIWSDKFIDNIADVYRKRKTEVPEKPISTAGNYISDAGNPINDIENTQSKVKESKVKEIKEEDPTPLEEIKNSWNEFAEQVGLSKVLKLSDQRIKHVKNRIQENEFQFEQILENIRGSTFLLGENDRGWKADFDFVFGSKNNYLKILEGKYATNGKSNSSSGSITANGDKVKQYDTFG